MSGIRRRTRPVPHSPTLPTEAVELLQHPRRIIRAQQLSEPCRAEPEERAFLLFLVTNAGPGPCLVLDVVARGVGVIAHLTSVTAATAFLPLTLGRCRPQLSHRQKSDDGRHCDDGNIHQKVGPTHSELAAHDRRQYAERDGEGYAYEQPHGRPQQSE
jgi:hypothetical protein